MAKYQFEILNLDRTELRSSGPDLDKLNAMGSSGWRIVHIREDDGTERNLTIVMEREMP